MTCACGLGGSCRCGVPAVAPADAAGACDDLLARLDTGFGAWGDCRDIGDLDKLAAAWSSIDTDITALEPKLKGESLSQAAVAHNQYIAFKLFDWAMRSTGNEETTSSDQIEQFRYWETKCEEWRTWYKAVSGRAPHGTSPVKDERTVFEKAGDTAERAIKLALFAAGAYVLIQAVRG